MKTIRTGSDFSGIGAFDYAIQEATQNTDTEIKNVFACDIDKHAKKAYLHNHDAPEYYANDVYKRAIPAEPLDVYMTSPPCQAFSTAGNRKGKEDERGILFYNSLEFIRENNPRFFIFENVEGLVSHDSGRTFGEWVRLLGGKSVNGLPVIFPDEDAVSYHIYYRVLNASHYGIPQSRKRIFIIGIRDDADNVFSFPKEQPLTIRIKDILEDVTTDKYDLSEKAIKLLIKRQKFNAFNPLDVDGISKCVTARANKISNDNNFIRITSANSKGFDECAPYDSVNYCNLNSKTNRGRVGKNGICNTIDTAATQSVYIPSDDPENIKLRRLTPRECLRLMGFPDSFELVVSDSQTYKQAGNSIVVNVLAEILKNLRL
jgi:DNA (cytosine-5)-methyltransferase 1